MKKSKIIQLIALIIAVLILAAACATPDKPAAPSAEKKFVVAYCQGESTSAWKLAQNDSMKKAIEGQGWEFRFADAGGSTPKQVADVEDFVNQGVDYICVSPREMDGLQPALDAAKKAKIPVLLIDREINAKYGEDYLTFIGGDFHLEGVTAGNFIKDKWPNAKVVEITGTPATSVAMDRTNGFAEAIKGSGVTLVSQQNGDWSRATAEKVMANVAQAQKGNFDVVYSHSDEMTFGIIVALKSAGLQPGKDVYIVSVDGQRLAIELIIEGEMAAIVECTPLHGPKAVEVIKDHLAGKTIPPKHILTGLVFDEKNAKDLLDRGV